MVNKDRQRNKKNQGNTGKKITGGNNESSPSQKVPEIVPDKGVTGNPPSSSNQNPNQDNNLSEEEEEGLLGIKSKYGSMPYQLSSLNLSVKSHKMFPAKPTKLVSQPDTLDGFLERNFIKTKEEADLMKRIFTHTIEESNLTKEKNILGTSVTIDLLRAMLTSSVQLEDLLAHESNRNNLANLLDEKLGEVVRGGLGTLYKFGYDDKMAMFIAQDDNIYKNISSYIGFDKLFGQMVEGGYVLDGKQMVEAVRQSSVLMVELSCIYKLFNKDTKGMDFLDEIEILELIDSEDTKGSKHICSSYASVMDMRDKDQQLAMKNSLFCAYKHLYSYGVNFGKNRRDGNQYSNKIVSNNVIRLNKFCKDSNVSEAMHLISKWVVSLVPAKLMILGLRYDFINSYVPYSIRLSDVPSNIYSLSILELVINILGKVEGLLGKKLNMVIKDYRVDNISKYNEKRSEAKIHELVKNVPLFLMHSDLDQDKIKGTNKSLEVLMNFNLKECVEYGLSFMKSLVSHKFFGVLVKNYPNLSGVERKVIFAKIEVNNQISAELDMLVNYLESRGTINKVGSQLIVIGDAIDGLNNLLESASDNSKEPMRILYINLVAKALGLERRVLDNYTLAIGDQNQKLEESNNSGKIDKIKMLKRKREDLDDGNATKRARVNVDSNEVSEESVDML